VAGVEIKRTGMAHSLFYTFENFKNAVERDINPKNKEILTDLCLLFGAHTILNNSPAIVEGGFIQPAHLSSLMRLKEELLNKLRSQLIGLLDSFVLPEKIIRSALTTGDPYQVPSIRFRTILNSPENAKSTTKFLIPLSSSRTTSNEQ
jgi:hypothetical protein